MTLEKRAQIAGDFFILSASDVLPTGVSPKVYGITEISDDKYLLPLRLQPVTIPSTSPTVLLIQTR